MEERDYLMDLVLFEGGYLHQQTSEYSNEELAFLLSGVRYRRLADEDGLALIICRAVNMGMGTNFKRGQRAKVSDFTGRTKTARSYHPFLKQDPAEEIAAARARIERIQALHKKNKRKKDATRAGSKSKSKRRH